MRSISAFSLGVLASAAVFFAVAAAPSAIGGDDCAPGGAQPAAAPAAPGAPAAAAVAVAPAKEPALTNALLLGMVGEWGCDCAYPAGGHAAGGASAALALDGTALLTTSAMDWTVGENKAEKIFGLGVWKVGADGKSLSYWGFSSHDSTADLLTGELTDTGATVAGETRWGPMRLTLSLKDGELSQQLWLNRRDMGVVTYKKK